MTRLEPRRDPNLAAGVRRRFLPYAPHTLEALLPLEARRVVVDDLDVTDEAVRVDRCRIRPHVVPGWRHVRVEFAMANVDSALGQVAFPEQGRVPFRHLLRVRCRDTRLRRAASLRPEADEYRGVVELDRQDVETAVFVEAAAVLEEGRSAVGPSRAGERFSWLARSPRWLIEVDETSGPAGGAFDFAWVDFSDPRPEPPYRGEDAGHLAACPDALCHVVVRPNGPLVLVNRRHDAVRGVLQSKGTVGVAARLRDVLLGRVAVESWRTIVSEAVTALESPGEGGPEDEEVADLGGEHWTTAVLRHAAKSAKCSRDELVQRLRDPTERSGLLFVLSENLGRVGVDAVRKLVEEVQRG